MLPASPPVCQPVPAADQRLEIDRVLLQQTFAISHSHCPERTNGPANGFAEFAGRLNRHDQFATDICDSEPLVLLSSRAVAKLTLCETCSLTLVAFVIIFVLRSAKFLGDEKPFRPADIAEPIGVFILDYFAYELGTALAELFKRLVDVIDGEHDAEVP
jgi:hypothetical protein